MRFAVTVHGEPDDLRPRLDQAGIATKGSGDTGGTAPMVMFELEAKDEASIRALVKVAIGDGWEVDVRPIVD
jgi:hypothetical protein